MKIKILSLLLILPCFMLGMNAGHYAIEQAVTQLNESLTNSSQSLNASLEALTQATNKLQRPVITVQKTPGSTAFILLKKAAEKKSYHPTIQPTDNELVTLFHEAENGSPVALAIIKTFLK